MSSAPLRDGLAPSRLHLPRGTWRTVLEALVAQFPRVPEATWRERFAQGLVLDAEGLPLAPDAACRVGLQVQYYRDVPAEASIPFAATLLHADAHLVVADKPHFLPVTPAGGHVRETLLRRLVDQLGNPDLVPLHRIDRATAGLVLFSVQAGSRAAYQALFRERRIAKRYEALAAPLPGLEFPLVRRSRIVPGEPFFRMQEAPGDANSETRLDVLERGSRLWRYALAPVTGRKHQLRVHMAALGAPILHDDFYPRLQPQAACDHSRPLQLLAKALSFADPRTGETRHFESRQALWPLQESAGESRYARAMETSS